MKTYPAYTVFLVDDDKMFLMSLEKYLQEKLKETITIRTFSSGEECIKAMHLQKPNIIILDYFLNSNYPFAMDGRSVLEKIKQVYLDMFVIMISGQEKIEVAIDSMKHGAFDYVIKNDNAFLKTFNVLKNAMSSLSLSQKLRKQSFLLGIAVSLFLLVSISALALCFFNFS